MKEFDGKVMYPYTDTCKNGVMKLLEKHYSKEEVDTVYNTIHLKYMEYLEKFNRDLGGKKNSRNRVAGTYDCIFMFCVYEVCKDKVDLMELEDLTCGLLLPSFEKLSFVDLNKPIFKRLFNFATKVACTKGNKFNDYHAIVEPYDKDLPIRYHFTTCPVADFAKQFGFEDVLPYLCNADYKTLELLNAKLVRVHTLGNGDYCDYAICGNQDSYLKEHEEYRDEKGYIRNK